MRHGFTLLELSIVLVIIGLIIGGITAGQGLIRAAELNSVISDVNKYKVAINTFKLKYNALPGDMNNATAYWGEAHATPATCKTTASTGTETCDGNGDGIVEPTNTGSDEDLRAWQHLANAQITSGQYNGIQDATTYMDIGINTPRSPISSASYWLHSTSWALGNRYFTKSGNLISFSAPVASNYPLGAVLSVVDAVQIDQKADDGIAHQGKIFGITSEDGASPGCSNDYGSSGNDYLLSISGVGCFLAFWLD